MKTNSHARNDPAPGLPPHPVTDADFEVVRNCWAAIRSRGELPHLHVEGGIYFVTFRMFDAVCPAPAVRVAVAQPAPSTQPQAGSLHHNTPTLRPSASRLHDPQAAWMEALQEAEEIAESSEPPLRAGSCILGRPEAARIVRGALRHFDGQRYTLHAWCIMPNHVHAVLAPWAGHTLSGILHSWKSFTSTLLNRLVGRTGPFWERESFDHVIRNLASFEKFVDYTVQNPVVAGFCASAEQWEFSSAFET